MEFVRFRHKGLRQLYEDDTAKGVHPAIADKLRKLLFAIETADGIEQVGRFPGSKLHPLKGESRRILESDPGTNTASDINLVDYH